jgi:hypothetical protein
MASNPSREKTHVIQQAQSILALRDHSRARLEQVAISAPNNSTRRRRRYISSSSAKRNPSNSDNAVEKVISAGAAKVKFSDKR